MTSPPHLPSVDLKEELVDGHREVIKSTTEAVIETAETVGSGSPFSCLSSADSSSGYHIIEKRLSEAVLAMLELVERDQGGEEPSEEIRKVIIERLRSVVADLLSGARLSTERSSACRHLVSALNLVVRVFEYPKEEREAAIKEALLALRGVVASCPLTQHSPDRMTAEAQDSVLAAAGIVYVGLALYQNCKEPCTANRSRAQDGLGFLHRSSDVREEFEGYITHLYREVHFPHADSTEWPEATGLVRLVRRLNDMVWAAEVTDSDAANFVHPVVCLPASKVVIAPVSECLEGIRKGGAMLLDFNVTKVEHDVIYTMWFSSDDGSVRWQIDYTYDHFLDLSRRLAKANPKCPPLPATRYSLITTILSHHDDIDDQLTSDLGHWVKNIVESEGGPIIEQAFGLGAALRRPIERGNSELEDHRS